MRDLHNHTLRSIHFDWKQARTDLMLEGHSANCILIANGVRDLHVPHMETWGPSVSVNVVKGPVEIAGGAKRLTIQMQSGDEITVTATHFSLEPA
jgi:hypothetical protein